MTARHRILARAGLLAVLMLATVAGAAHAIAPAPHPDPLTVARTAWPESPCAGRETVIVTDDLYNPPELADAEAILDGSCTVKVRPRAARNRVGLCNVLAHELGHLAGRDDEPNSPGLMGSAPSLPACRSVLPTARSWAADAVKLPESSCRLRRARVVDGVRERTYLCARVVVTVEVVNGRPVGASY